MLRNLCIFTILVLSLAASGCVKSLNRQVITEPTTFYSNSPELSITFAQPMTYLDNIDNRRYIKDNARGVSGREKTETHLLVSGKDSLVEHCAVITFKSLGSRWVYNPIDKRTYPSALYADEPTLAGKTYHGYVEVLHNAGEFAKSNGLVEESTSLTFKQDYLVYTLKRIHRGNELISIHYAEPVPDELQGKKWKRGMLSDAQKQAVFAVREHMSTFMTFHEDAPALAQQ